MSWKGLTKAVSRLPHTLSTKTGIRDETVDLEFRELNTRFTACEKTTTVLIAEATKYRDSVTGMLNHQAEFGIVLAEVYDPSLGVPDGEVTPRRVQTAPESIQAVDDFQAVMREMRDLLLPEVDKLDQTVLGPLTEMQSHMKLIRKTILKRDHKLVDYDRFRISLKKLQDKKDRTLSEEKQIYKLESQLEVATADYEGLNSLLREELPGFFYLRTQLMEPIFYAFFFLQTRIYTILMDRIDPLSRSGYYDLTMDIAQGYEARKSDISPTIESVELITKKSVGATYTSKYGRPSQDNGSPSTLGETKSYSPPTPAAKPWQTATVSKPWQTSAAAPQTAPKPWQAAGAGAPQTATKPWQAVGRTSQDHSSPPPPAYSSAVSPAASATTSGTGPRPGGPNIHLHVSPFGTSLATAAVLAAGTSAYNAGKSAIANKRPPPPVPKRLGAKMVIALYDYDAQQEGDLTFRKDDRIEIVEKTANTEDWWTGKLNGRQGVFPGNYVREL